MPDAWRPGDRGSDLRKVGSQRPLRQSRGALVQPAFEQGSNDSVGPEAMEARAQENLLFPVGRKPRAGLENFQFAASFAT
jgi:hypothetical protein